MRRVCSRLFASLLLAAGVPLVAASTCERPVYLSFDTGHMEVAPLVAEVLQRHGVKATFAIAL